MIEYGTKPREVGSTKKDEQVDTPKVETKDEVKESKPSKSKPKGKGKSKSKKTEVKSQESTEAVSEVVASTAQESSETVELEEVVVPKSESEGSDIESDRFPDSTSTVEAEHLEVTEVEEVNVQELLANLDTLTAELDSLSKALDEHKSKIEVLANENKVLKAKVDTALKGVFSALRYTLKESFNRLFGRKQK